MANRRIALYRRTVPTIIGRSLTVRDGVPEKQLRQAEKRLGFPLPAAIREYYSAAGAAAENREHNRLFTPEELVVEDGHLVFMEENQVVVHWGVSIKGKKRADPDVLQRIRDETEWYSEEMTFSVFILKNFAWQRGVELSIS